MVVGTEGMEADCTGTLIVHALLRSDCTEDQCTTPEIMAHAFVVDCDAVGCECAQPIGSAAVRAS
ncbi:hypothetical protein [Mycolicibacterium tokaiense]|nr:hypothetical protein [Mycolicibacterium tokaiense]